MLVLSRKAGEKLLIGNDISIEIVKVSGNRVTIGIKAPGSVAILRQELVKNRVSSTEATKTTECPILSQAL